MQTQKRIALLRLLIRLGKKLRRTSWCTLLARLLPVPGLCWV